jgi:hypothetical protein
MNRPGFRGGFSCWLGDGQLHVGQAPPRSSLLAQLGLVEPDRALHQRAVVPVAGLADGGACAGPEQGRGEAERGVLDRIGMVHWAEPGWRFHRPIPFRRSDEQLPNASLLARTRRTGRSVE